MKSDCLNPDDPNYISIGDVVRVNFLDKPAEGIVVDRINDFQVKVDFGDYNKVVMTENCVVVYGINEYEVGDKVEVKGTGMNLYFVGKVINVHEDKTLDVLMDGDDPDDIERHVSIENVRKLMSRRALVVNRWKRAFMMVVAANFFKKISFVPEQKDAK